MAASNFSALAFALLFALLGLRGVKGAIKCEELPAQACAFSVSSTGARCVLEKYVLRDGTLQFRCQPSLVMAEKMIEWIESEECINACGLERMWVGMSSDSLLEADFTSRLCSESCQNNCPNIVDLYLNLAAAEASVSIYHGCARLKGAALGDRWQRSWVAPNCRASHTILLELLLPNTPTLATSLLRLLHPSNYALILAERYGNTTQITCHGLCTAFKFDDDIKNSERPLGKGGYETYCTRTFDRR